LLNVFFITANFVNQKMMFGKIGELFWGCLRGYAYMNFHELPPGEQGKDMLNIKLDTTP
jgi:hypothetical protein